VLAKTKIDSTLVKKLEQIEQKISKLRMKKLY